MATATNAQKIAGLYAAFFERAPDAAGLSYWENQFTGTATINDLAKQFAANPVFTATYGGQTDVQFVNSIYLNVLGAAGDAKGVDYWVTYLKNGGADARANFVAQFVSDALTVDLSKFTDLTAEELAVAQSRQDTLTNKANVGLYFAEKFGTASNVTTTGDITKDPAYLAAVAAVKGVTADAASVAAAEGRIDVAVGTSDPAGSLVGQNSALTAGLVDLQKKIVAEDAAKDALALAVNAAAATPKTGDDLKDFVDLFTVKASDLTDANQAIATAQAAQTGAAKSLADARATTGTDGLLLSDTKLAANVTAATDAVNANTAAKALLATSLSAKAVVAGTTDVAVLTSLHDALTAFVKAGGANGAKLNATDTVGSVTDEITALLNLKVGDTLKGAPATALTIAAAQKEFVSGLIDETKIDNSVTPPVTGEKYELVLAGSTATANETALTTAITKAEARDTAYVASAKADADLKADPLGGKLVAAQDAVTERNDLIKANTDATAAVAKEQADLAKITAAYDAHTAADASVTAAEKVITDLGYTIGTDATAAKDLIVGDVAKAGTTQTVNGGFAAGDELFIGTQFKFGGVTDSTATPTALADLYAKGSASALEVFFEQQGANTVVHVETKAFANAEATPVDFATITLTGVTAANLTFENGFVHNAAAATA